ncbi:peptidase MA family metallohydrolase [Sporolituus thermophilus]|uniref:Peptidase MA superfamily protein n=1 Tax=Sporolituus thermophilus DSM 23256 TaxID=1123285 RepID=A0A1G7MW88_9FIRM|nr:peptidase MA family metallohydrolase [Sporolituus thermophilus]SDF65931.1 Peptidase MA superfamily protein [Sporolituus thermophilus DSM 23256]
MRTILFHDKVTALIALGLVVALLALVPAQLPRMWLYPLARQLAAAKIAYQTRDMAVYETPHFIIKYTAADADTVAMLATAAEAAYGPVTQALRYEPAEKTLLLVYPDRQQLNQAFGWSGDQSAMGVYWGGVIRILSPHVWLKAGESTKEFIHKGPMVHEFTHLVFDHMTSGNYTRWFTEGLAQYMEYRANGYEWLTPRNKLTGKLYTMAELDENFDNLPEQSLAYREALAAVRYIAEVHGEDKLMAIIADLQKGRSTEAAITGALGMDYQAFEQAWQRWAVTNMKNYDEK